MSQVFGTFSLVQVQGFCRILPDFRGAEQPSLPLKVLMAMDLGLVQQALINSFSLHIFVQFTLLMSDYLEVLASSGQLAEAPKILREIPQSYSDIQAVRDWLTKQNR